MSEPATTTPSWSGSRREAPTFNRFVSGPENIAALAAAREVSAQVGSRRNPRRCNPLLLHGPSGTGKTHLTAAAASEALRQAPEVRIWARGAADFADHLRDPAVADPLEPARQADLVVIEDLHFMPPFAAEALSQLIDHRLGRQQAVICTSPVGPQRLAHLGARLTSRLTGGLVVALEPLAAASRLALLRDKASRRQLAISDEILAWLAEQLTGGGRQLEGAITQLEVLARQLPHPPDLPTVQRHLRDLTTAQRLTIESIADRVSGCFQVDLRHLRSARRSRAVLWARQVAMYLARQLTERSLEQIGAYFGGRDHSTVLHACRKVEDAVQRETVAAGPVRQLLAELT